MKIIVTRLSAIGDCTLVLPVIRAILKQQPEAEVYWLIGKAAYQLLQYSAHPRLHYIAIDKPKRWSDYRAIKGQLANIEFDILLAMQASTRSNLLYPLIKAKSKIGFDKQRARELQWLFTNQKITFRPEHLHDSFCQFAEAIGVKCENLDWHIELADKLQLPELPKQYIAVNPAASKLERSWFSERYAQLIDWLEEKYHLPVVLTGGQAAFEVELSERIFEQCQHKPINLVGKTSLNQLAAILRDALLLVAPDTGPSHIANAMATPVIGLYAVASSRLSGPYHYQELVIDKFEQAVTTILKKDPEAISWKTRVHDRQAMALIELAEVKDKVEQGLASIKFSNRSPLAD